MIASSIDYKSATSVKNFNGVKAYWQVLAGRAKRAQIGIPTLTEKLKIKRPAVFSRSGQQRLQHILFADNPDNFLAFHNGQRVIFFVDH